jgi:hypothetical protein
LAKSRTERGQDMRICGTRGGSISKHVVGKREGKPFVGAAELVRGRGDAT